jgi:hypothetical protein
MNTAKKFDDRHVGKKTILAAGGVWHEDKNAYTFPDGSAGRFTDIRNGAQESRLRFVAADEPLEG